MGATDGGELSRDGLVAAESAVLGALLLDPAAVGRVKRLRPGDFRDPRHGLIFSALQDEFEDTGSGDALTVYDRLHRAGYTDAEFGGLAYLGALSAASLGAANVERHAALVEAEARKRDTIGALRQAATLFKLGNEDDALALLDDLRAKPRDLGDALRVTYPGEARPRLSGRYWIKGLLTPGLGMAFGASNAGKTAAVFDLVAHVAAGIDYRGRRTRRGLVVWLALEAPASFENRLAAWLQHHGMNAVDLRLVSVAGALDLRDAGSVRALRDTLTAIESRMGEPPAVLVIDTLARAMPGADENAGADMGRAVAALDAMQARFPNLSVVTIHHSGKDATRGARGHSSLTAAVDWAIEVKAGDLREMTIVKARDGATGESLAFDLQAVELGRDEDGDPVTAVVVVEAGPGLGHRRPPAKLSDGAKLALRLLRDLLRREGAGVAGLDAPPGTVAVRVDRWRSRHKVSLCAGTGEDATKSGAAERKAWERALTSLQAAGIVSISSEWAFANDKKPRD